MTFRNDFQKSSARAERRSGGSGRTIAIGGGSLGGLVLIGLFLLLGGDPSDLNQITGVQGGNSPNSVEQTASQDNCQTGADANEKVDCRVEFTGISLDHVWSQQLPAQAGIEYTQPNLVLFSQGTRTGCGAASSSTGPFYCPADETAYFDGDFFHTLEQMGGGNGPLAQEYVVAHEFGHHLQKLEGTLGLSDYNNPGADSDAVKIELQADCYAGIWAHYADKGPDAILEPLSDEQVADTLKTTTAIGDDTIQQHSGQGVQPDSWTHGSAEQRTEYFLTGYKTGQMSQCDTLQRGVYR
ncbi:MAG: neutral zinc metallopeptidase [Corynebacterium sp.]|uniref:KPN_02809 family neutral zinc metallopeptidase n=1 Tax=Corynebacterium sp. TaxID=1720 RepID=UPI0026DD8CFA|nr:neutral zinc metallopeptidase [Corynebacterium sp.]MDO5029144.1 neutral zinc metallopeptidase [Corynebacterium sp.]